MTAAVCSVQVAEDGHGDQRQRRDHHHHAQDERVGVALVGCAVHTGNRIARIHLTIHHVENLLIRLNGAGLYVISGEGRLLCGASRLLAVS